ncbi:MAG TPA: CRTAC1 family protein, partial [Bryobacteraceae bacterium]|nr:CRTAC1 family protein [Bryobacteraceae bacterium]
ETFPLFRNNGKGQFMEITAPSGMLRASSTMAGYSPTIADFDNDGWKDIFVSRGHVQATNMARQIAVDQPNTVFRNLRGTRFSPLTEEAGLTGARRHRGSAVGDFNHDGKLDVVVSALSARAELWLNDSPGTAHWIECALEGTKSNRQGIGARIKIVSQHGVQYNHATTSVGYASSSAGPVHFGLGPAAAVELIEVEWPSGARQTLRNVAADRVIRLKEPR